MKKNLLFGMLTIVVVCATLPVSCHKQEELGTDPVGPDRSLPYTNEDWMRLIPDDRYLSEISIPGTHDAGADLHTSEQGTMSKYTICQDFRISNQLKLGVRWLDIRLRLDNGSLTVHHADYYLHKNFNDVLNAALDFVAAHPTEAVVLMIKQEHSSESDSDFQHAVMSYIEARSNWEGRFYLENRVPTMGEVRGKVVIVRQYTNARSLAEPGMMFKWDGNTTGGYFVNDGVHIYVQDHYSLGTVDYSTKIDEIKDCAVKAHTDTDRQRFYLNFASGEKQLSHYLETVASNIQPEIESWLCTPSIYRKCGIIMVNFAGGSDDGEVEKWLVDDIVASNDFEVKIEGAFPQTWKAYNLDVTHYRNGDPIPHVTDPNVWDTLSTGAWCWYGGSGGSGHWGIGYTYGKLYNWHAVHDPRGLAPEGWRVASMGDWTIFVDFHGGWENAGGKLKSLDHWMSPNTGATDELGFSARPGGFCSGNGGSPDHPFLGRQEYGWFWTSTDEGGVHATAMVMAYFSAAVTQESWDKTWGYSVRLIKE